MSIKLTKMKRQNTYSATSEILLDGVSIGELKTNYGYTPEDKLRVKSYDVIFRAELPSGKVFESSNYFEVDGRWETKGSRGGFLQGPRCYLAEYETYSTEYKTAKEAKAAAMAYIKEIVEAAAAEEAAETVEAVEAVEAAETPVEVQTMNWLENKQTRLKDKRLVYLSIEIFINEEGHYFPWTDEGFKAAYTFMYKHYDQLRNDDDNTIRIVADEGFEWSEPEYIWRSELSQKDWYKWYQCQRGKYNQ